MTAFAGPRIATRHRVSTRTPRSGAFSAVRGSFDGLRGAFRASADTRGADYADALLLGRN